MLQRILFADPDQALLESYRQYFQGRGYEVEVASNGPQCLCTFLTFRPDIVVLEPELTGSWSDQFLGQLNEFQSHPAVPVIILTRRDRREPASTSQLAFTKPIRLSRLAAAVKRLLRERSRPPSAVPALPRLTTLAQPV